MTLKLSRTKQIENQYNVTLKRINYEGFLTYDIYYKEGNSTCEWLETLDEVEKYLKEKSEVQNDT